MRTSHTSDLLGAPSTNISPLSMEDTHIKHVEVPFTSPGVPLVTSSPQPLEAMSNAKESVSIANVNKGRQNDDHGRGHGRRCGRRYGHCEHERVHASPIEPMVGHHGLSVQKKEGSFVWYSSRMLLHLTCISDIFSILDVGTCNVYFGYFHL